MVTTDFNGLYNNIDHTESACYIAMAEKGLKPILWLRCIDDVFFLRTYDEQSLKDFIRFIQKYSESKNMKSVLKYDVHYRTEEVTF